MTDIRDAITEAMQAFLRDSDPAQPIYQADIQRVLERLLGVPVSPRSRRGRPRSWADLDAVWCDGWPFPRSMRPTLH
jgi:hypothetical protein